MQYIQHIRKESLSIIRLDFYFIFIFFITYLFWLGLFRCLVFESEVGCCCQLNLFFFHINYTFIVFLFTLGIALEWVIIDNLTDVSSIIIFIFYSVIFFLFCFGMFVYLLMVIITIICLVASLFFQFTVFFCIWISLASFQLCMIESMRASQFSIQPSHIQIEYNNRIKSKQQVMHSNVFGSC